MDGRRGNGACHLLFNTITSCDIILSIARLINFQRIFGLPNYGTLDGHKKSLAEGASSSEMMVNFPRVVVTNDQINPQRIYPGQMCVQSHRSLMDIFNTRREIGKPSHKWWLF